MMNIGVKLNLCVCFSGRRSFEEPKQKRGGLCQVSILALINCHCCRAYKSFCRGKFVVQMYFMCADMVLPLPTIFHHSVDKVKADN